MELAEIIYEENWRRSTEKSKIENGGVDMLKMISKDDMRTLTKTINDEYASFSNERLVVLELSGYWKVF